MTEMPKKIKIGYQEVSVVPEKSSLSDVHGNYNTTTATICVNTDNNRVEIVNTLMHEIFHAVWYSYGLTAAYPDRDKHEHIVTTMANAMTQVYRDNVGLLEWIDSNLKEPSDGA